MKTDHSLNNIFFNDFKIMYIQYIMEKHIYFLTVILVILVCFFLFRYLSNDYLEYKKLNPYLIENTRQLSNSIQPINSNKIRKSIDQHRGMEFTYAFWFKIDSIENTSIEPGERANILSKGDTSDVACPGINVFKDNDNTMALEIDISVFSQKHSCDKYDEDNCVKNKCNWDKTDSKCIPWECEQISDVNIDCNTPSGDQPCCPQLSDYCNVNSDNKCEPKLKEKCIVNNIPIQKWTHLIVMLVGNYLDVFINGNLYERFEIKGVPRQNNDDLHIGGANGSIMRLQYFNYAIPASKINKIVSVNEITRSAEQEQEYVNDSTVDYLDDNYWIGENSSSNKKMF